MSEQSALAWEDPDDLQKQTYASVARTQGGGYAEVLQFVPSQRRLKRISLVTRVDTPEDDETEGTKKLENVE